MWKTDLWIHVPEHGTTKTDKEYRYSLEIDRNGKLTRVCGDGTAAAATWNRAALECLAAGLSRFRQSAEVHIHSDNAWMLGSLEHYLDGWAEKDFATKTGEVANADIWRQIAAKKQGLKLVCVRHGFGEDDRKMMIEHTKEE